jgi:predicted kinase
LGRKPSEPLPGGAWSEAYSPSATTAVYDAILGFADVVLSSGRPVVIDASFRTVAMRDAARRLANAHQVPFTLVECRAPRPLILERLTARESGKPQESDARADLLAEFEERFEPVEELRASDHLALDTSRSVHEVRSVLEAAFKS